MATAGAASAGVRLAGRDKCQLYCGGTDAGAIHKNYDGILTFTQCLCARSIHTCSTILDSDDYVSCLNLTLHMLKTLTSAKIISLQEED